MSKSSKAPNSHKYAKNHDQFDNLNVSKESEMSSNRESPQEASLRNRSRKAKEIPVPKEEVEHDAELDKYEKEQVSKDTIK